MNADGPPVEATLANSNVPPLAHTALATGTSRHSACGREWGTTFQPVDGAPLVHELATGICCASGGALWLEVEAPFLPNRCLHLAQQDNRRWAILRLAIDIGLQVPADGQSGRTRPGR
jgi:hypothetical protein